ncbi:hypothetical protein MRX96_032647 [Rhipicephalus microplus]
MSMIWGAGAFPGLCIPVDYCDATCVAGYDTARMRDLRLSTLSSLSNGLLRSGGPVKKNSIQSAAELAWCASDITWQLNTAVLLVTDTWFLDCGR